MQCIGDLYSTSEQSKFLLIYYDWNKSEYIIECNKVAFEIYGKVCGAYGIEKDFSRQYTIIKSTNTNTEFQEKSLDNYDIEYITIAETTGNYLYPNANNSPYGIPRFGLSYKRCGKQHVFQYLCDKGEDNDDNKQSFYNNNLNISIEIKDFITEKNKYKIKLLPEKYPNMSCGFDYAQKPEIYKSVFMLRFFEKVLNSMDGIEIDFVRAEVVELEDSVKKCKGDIKSLIIEYDNIKQIIINIREKLKQNNIGSKNDIKLCYEKFIAQLEQLIKTIDINYFSYSYQASIDIDVKDKNFNHNILGELENTFCYIDKHDIEMEFWNILDVKFNNLSDGLKYLLTVYSAIHKCLNQNPKEKYKNIILLLDELEVHMHPEWARRLMQNLMEFLAVNFKDNNFQIIVSTHSPYMLSDILRDNVILLTKDEIGKTQVRNCEFLTFGSNIHDLLKNSFFMDSTRGEFARQQINGVLRFLNGEKQKNMNKQKAKLVIDNIGEKIIKNKLNKMYYERFPQEIEDREKKLQAYQNKIEELYNNINQSVNENNYKLLSLEKELKDVLKGISSMLSDSGDSNDKN